MSGSFDRIRVLIVEDNAHMSTILRTILQGFGVRTIVEVRDAGNLLQRVGFALPVIDSDCLTITYPSPLKLLHELRAMGENNMLTDQTRTTLPREYMLQTMAHYQSAYGAEDGRIPATVEIISITTWAPDASQPKPAARGSGKVNLGEIL